MNRMRIALTAGLAAVVSLAQAGESDMTATDWPSWRGPSAKGSAAVDAAKLMDDPSQARLVWESEAEIPPSGNNHLGKWTTGWSSPCVADGRVFLFWYEGDEHVIDPGGAAQDPGSVAAQDQECRRQRDRALRRRRYRQDAVEDDADQRPMEGCVQAGNHGRAARQGYGCQPAGNRAAARRADTSAWPPPMGWCLPSARRHGPSASMPPRASSSGTRRSESSMRSSRRRAARSSARIC